jgi:hypothetical protein
LDFGLVECSDGGNKSVKGYPSIFGQKARHISISAMKKSNLPKFKALSKKIA